jgi:hypothetical protein
LKWCLEEAGELVWHLAWVHFQEVHCFFAQFPDLGKSDHERSLVLGEEILEALAPSRPQKVVGLGLRSSAIHHTHLNMCLVSF